MCSLKKAYAHTIHPIDFYPKLNCLQKGLTSGQKKKQLEGSVTPKYFQYIILGCDVIQETRCAGVSFENGYIDDVIS